MNSDERGWRRRRVEAVWNWLPAFRRVAEVQNLSEAARLLAVSKSALSRTVRLLEEELGVALFVRDQGALTLTEAGAALLAAAHLAMRTIDEGLVARAPLSVRVACDEGSAAWTAHALPTTWTPPPELVPAGPAPLLDLARGAVDVVVLAQAEAPVVSSELQVFPAAPLPQGAYRRAGGDDGGGGPGAKEARSAGSQALAWALLLRGDDVVFPDALAAPLGLQRVADAAPLPAFVIVRRGFSESVRQVLRALAVSGP